MVIDMSQLYKDATAAEWGGFVYAEINGKLFRSIECHGFRPRGWIDNMFALFAANNYMYKEKKLIGRVNRVIFSSLFTSFTMDKAFFELVVHDLPKQPNL
ncbi:hypothetical protein DEO72_LG7g1051 [Vigna unguiculata]|uniref:Uncharacterized protein n=1 Tax=Vigna unguiculata TaxID=3917 RepID=A0A4D6MEH7_VIGUN|nr:hypothetical protein DEO72_LG7g1051 [Vigna unguiculata]